MSHPTNTQDLRLLILDLDGTLIDSRADLVASVNATLEHLGRSRLPDAAIAGYVGDGAALLMMRALGLLPAPDRRGPAQAPPILTPDAQALADEALEYFLRYYTEHKLDATTLYPGVEAGLAALGAAGFRMAVLTNKPVRASREIVAGLGIASWFFSVRGGNSFLRKKPDPLGLNTLMAECGLRPAQTVMMGDSSVDIRTGRNAGAWTLGVSYGFQPETLIAEPPDWTAASFSAAAAELIAARDGANLPK